MRIETQESKMRQTKTVEGKDNGVHGRYEIPKQESCAMLFVERMALFYPQTKI